ncbi:TPR-like protein [Basidiobolus meristosporus CBS 931.73]|uniref:TPR-like protein n=1 Tax=Basidiobolus meristosporus CBS 931.73 TaxID=1314790 RepID=A0A1Y1XNV1_9FUNG|nr:TPR-like protein [Basidiobolus meristosporus CBS 931.73]|eukprot:ORX87429.1 TPR-like protein [Basidiobolus meristosporus CBS 931.73]
MSQYSDFSERRLRPIYDAIDNQNYKQALQLCSKILKKQNDILIVQALKALTLERTGKEEEALEICKFIKKRMPIDEPTLQIVGMVYRSLGNHQDMVDLYGNASKMLPNNEELANHWFMAMVRANDFKGQQQAALKLHKTFKHNKYLFWAIMSLVLQAKENEGQRALFNSLSERMMKKAAEEGRLETTEDVHLYLAVLLSQEKHTEALELIEGDLGSKCKADMEFHRIRLELLSKLNKWEQILDISKKKLKENYDDWNHYQYYFTALMNFTKANPEEKATLFEEARRFLSEFVDKASSTPNPKRGPFLSMLEFEKELINEGSVTNNVKLIELIVQYFEKFGSKFCCFEDLQPYLNLITKEQAQEVLEKFLKSVPQVEKDDKANSVKNVQRNINIRKVERYVGLYSELSTEQTIEHVNQLVKAYIEALDYGRDLEETEKQYGDDYIVLATHALVDIWKKSGDVSFLFQALVLLENALKKSTYNFQFKFLAIRLYQILGVFQRSLELYKSMDIKHIQLDTLSHMIVESGADLGFSEDLVGVIYESLGIYSSNTTETPEMIVQAYKYGTYSKIEEFIDFRRRLEDSLQRHLLDRGLVQEELAGLTSLDHLRNYFNDFDVTALKHDDKFCDSLCDNRDYEAYANWNPLSEKTCEKLTRPNPQRAIRWLKLRSVIPAVLKAIANDDQELTLAETTGFLESLLDEQSKEPADQEGLSHNDIWTTKVLIGLARVIGQTVGADLGINVESVLSGVAGLFREALSSIKETDTPTPGLLVRSISGYLEALNYLNFAFSIFQKYTNPKGKKQGHRAMDADTAKIVEKFVEEMKTLSREFKQYLKELSDSTTPKSKTKYLAELTKVSIEFVTNKENNGITNQTIQYCTSSWSNVFKHMSKELEKRSTLFK